MFRLFEKMQARFDRAVESSTRRSALAISRRNALATLGRAMVGGALLAPVLPFDRSGGHAHAASAHDVSDKECDYWRYCALDGNLCTCCGGSIHECPPGSQMSKVSWVGTCLNPKDGKAYLVSYNDCCGKGQCNRCACLRSERERPGYRMGLYNDINWCMANTSQAYHCTISAIVGVAENG